MPALPREPRPIAACVLSLAFGVLGSVPLSAEGATLDEPSPPPVGTQGTPRPVPAAEPSPDCRLDEPSRPASGTVLPPPAPAVRDAGCLVSAKDALGRWRAGQLLLVDVRPPAAFERFRVAGSLNIAPAFVKTKPFLRDQPFAMLSDTPASGELVALCAALKQVGFAQPRVLDGGLLAWRRAKGPIDGDPLAQRALTRVAPAEFAEARGDPRWLVVDLTSAPAKEVQAWLPGAVRAPATRDQAKLAANLESMAAKRAAKGRARRLLVVDADGAQLERLEAAIAHSLPQDVLFLEGGLAGWKRYWAEQNAIWAGSAGGPRKAKCGA